MADDKSLLQKLKLEISRSFRLTPYERIVFHKILAHNGIESSEVVLLDELDKGYEVRTSAIQALVHIQSQSVYDRLITILSEPKLNDYDISAIFRYYAQYKNSNDITFIIEYYNSNENLSPEIKNEIFNTLSELGGDSSELWDFLSKIIEEDADPISTEYAISSFNNIENIDYLCSLLNNKKTPYKKAIFQTLGKIAKSSDNEIADEHQATSNDNSIMLELRISLSKIAIVFDDFTPNEVVAYISVLAASNHREFFIYTMKAISLSDIAQRHKILQYLLLS